LINMDLLRDQLVRTYLPTMSREIFKIPYPALAEIIYPKPPYKLFLIAKRNGTARAIAEPRKRLKVLQKRLLEWLEAQAGTPRRCVHGFVRRRSILTNAQTHCSIKTTYVLNLDLENFFPSITFKRIVGVFRGRPFNCSVKVAQVLAHLCTFNGTLPQGAPTSPMLANLVCRTMDRDLTDLARAHQAKYTRYADDLTFSFTKRRTALPPNVCSFKSGELTLGDDLKAVIAKHSFTLNSAKSRLSGRSQRLEVTGLTINKAPNVKRVFVDRIRGALHAWEKHGYDSTQAAWEKRCVAAPKLAYEKRVWKRQTRTSIAPALKNVLWGKLLHLRMVRGKDDPIYARLAERYNRACMKEKNKGAFVCSSLPIEPVVRNDQDVDKAMFVTLWMGDTVPPRGDLPDGAPDHKPECIGGQGTAFAYRDVGLVTCDHVLGFKGDLKGTLVDLDMTDPKVTGAFLWVENPVTGVNCPVKIVHRDPVRDLAILQFMEAPPDHRYFSGMDAQINRNERGHLIGFPNWGNNRPAHQIDATVSMRYNRSTLERFEISQTIRAGNSGGPFVDTLYRVAGVAQQGASQNEGNNECLCVTALDAWIEMWKASQVPPPATAAPQPAVAPAPAVAAPVPAGPIVPAPPPALPAVP
jgi:RNA-directed DNA polymerase